MESSRPVMIVPQDRPFRWVLQIDTPVPKDRDCARLRKRVGVEALLVEKPMCRHSDVPHEIDDHPVPRDTLPAGKGRGKQILDVSVLAPDEILDDPSRGLDDFTVLLAIPAGDEWY